MELINSDGVLPKSSPSIWMISRIDQAAILASHLARQNRLVRWDSFWRHNGSGPVTPPSRQVDPILATIPGRHLIPDLLAKTAQKLRLPAHNLYSDIPLSLMAALQMPKADILHGQGNYSLPAMRRAKARGMITISDVTGQLGEIRQQQVADEYAAHQKTYREISSFLARRRTEEARFSDAVFAPSDAVADGLQRCGIAPGKIFLVPFVSPLCQSLLHRQRAAQTDTVMRLLYVGNLSLAKGTATLLAAWKSLRDQFRMRIKLTLVGTAKPCAMDLLKNLPDGCEWLGPLPQAAVADLMLGSDIFVFPSLSEGSSLATMEAMAAGCAVITTFDAGSPVINQISGLIIPPRDPSAISTAVTALINNPTMRRNIAQAGRAQIARDLQIGYGNRVDAAYEAVLSRHG
ncbi:glycosyltransferase family 4 protein [Thalassospira lucentensis]|uniref:glycosyltransferase family 4 protein n=1 Tax=Thalassospira lucentensis TaxID=168935 RepID=UPI003D2F502E